MKITKQQYAEAGLALGIEMPEWPGDTEFAGVLEVVVHLNDTDRHLAKRFWYYLLSSRLAFEQMGTVGLKLIEEAVHLLSCEYGRAADNDQFKERRLELSLALSSIHLANDFLGHWVDDRHEAYRQYYRETDQVQLETVQALFFLPWRLPEQVGDLINMLASACELIEKQFGIGPVGLDEEFSVMVRILGADPVQLNMKFMTKYRGIEGFLSVCWDDDDLWVSVRETDGVALVSEPFNANKGSLPEALRVYLALTPTMSRREIEEKLNTLTFTAENQQD